MRIWAISPPDTACPQLAFVLNTILSSNRTQRIDAINRSSVHSFYEDFETTALPTVKMSFSQQEIERPTEANLPVCRLLHLAALSNCVRKIEQILPRHPSGHFRRPNVRWHGCTDIGALCVGRGRNLGSQRNSSRSRNATTSKLGELLRLSWRSQVDPSRSDAKVMKLHVSPIRRRSPVARCSINSHSPRSSRSSLA